MSQNSSIDQTLLEPTSDSLEPSYIDAETDVSEEQVRAIASKPSEFSAEAYADRLMDELFDDIEQSLERGTKLPTEALKTEKADYISLQSLAIPKMVLPSLLAPRPVEEEPEPDLESLTAIAASETDTSRQRSGKSVDKLLMAAAGISLLITALLWFVFQSRSQQASAPPQPVAAADAPQEQGDREFLNYMQRSLEVIDRETQANQPVASATTPGAAAPTAAPGAAAPNLPTIPVPATISGSAPSPIASAPALERVYIPVYQPPQVSVPATAGSPAPSPAPVAAAPSSPAAVGAVPNIAPNANYVLVGVYESSNPSRSAALFEVNGVTQRIYVGEGIGSSGWILVSVNNDEAIVRRNGEVRSIYAGQNF